MRPAVAVLLATLVVAVCAASLRTEEPTPFGLAGFREVVLSVSDLERSAAAYTSVGGWKRIDEGTLDPARLSWWGVGEGVTARELVLRNPGTETGQLRLIQFAGARQELMRPTAQTWDTGGIFDFNVRVLDAEGKLDELRRAGWQGLTETIEFGFGPFVVREVLARDADGVVVAMIERVEPPLEGWPHLKKWSRIFNSTQIVADFDRALAFYRDLLGFRVYLEHRGASEKPGPNVLGLPYDVAAEVERRVAILSPDGTNSGSVEILSFEGLEGGDRSARARAPNLGILALRFPVTDLSGLRERLERRGAPPMAGPTELDLPAFDANDAARRVLALEAPEGARLEFVE